MNINKKSVALFVMLAAIIVYMEYEPSKLEDFTLPSKSILHFDETVFNMYHKKYDLVEDSNRYWGFEEDVSVDENLTDTNSSKEETQVTQPDGKNVLCIEGSCYRLLGIHYNYKIPMVTLYNSDLKEKVKDYKTEDILESAIVINKIISNSVEFAEQNTTRKWTFKLFDINETKYKPKETEE